MLEGNTKKAKVMPIASPISPSIVADKINAFRQSHKAAAQTEWVDNLVLSSNNNYFEKLNVTDDNLYKGYNSASQLDWFAAIVKAKWEDRWEDWSKEKSAKDVITRYIKEQHPKKWFVDRLAEFADSDIDPYDFALNEWAALTPEEQRANRYKEELERLFGDDLPSWLVKTYWWTQEILRDVWLPIDIWYNAVSNAVFSEYKDDEQWRLIWAIDNYAWRKFWKHIRELDKYELANAIRELQKTDENVIANWLFDKVWTNLEKYEANNRRAFTNALESVWWVAMSMAFPWVTSLFAVAEETPILEYWPALLNAYVQPMWQIINWLVPPLWLIRMQLPTDEDRQEWDTFVYSMFAIWNHERGGTKYDKMVKQDFLDFYNAVKPSALYKAFKSWKANKINNIKNWISNTISEWVDTVKNAVTKGIGKAKDYYNDSSLKSEVVEPTKEKYFWPDWESTKEVEIATDPEEIAKIENDMRELSTKISKWVEDTQRESVNETLKTLPRDTKAKTNSLQDLSDNVESSIMKRIIDAEDTILKKDRRKFKKQDIERLSSWEVSLEWTREEPYKSTYGSDPVEEAFRALRNMYEYEEWHAKTQAQAEIEVKWQKYLNEWLTRWEIAELARDLTRTFKLYKPKWMWPYETITSSTIEPIRKALKSIVREWYDVAWVKDALTELDRIYSNAATTNELVYDVIKKARQERGNKDVQTDTQGAASKVIKFTKNMRSALSDYVLNNKSLSPDMVDTYMNYLLKVHDSYFDRLWRKWNNFDKLIEATDKMAKELEVYETWPEWEVIDWAKMWEWVAEWPVSDWFTDTVDIIEPWKNAEQSVAVNNTKKWLSDLSKQGKEDAYNNYKNALWDVLRELWVKEWDIDAAVKYITEPLFEVEAEWTKTDFQWNDVTNKPKTTSRKNNKKTNEKDAWLFNE